MAQKKVSELTARTDLSENDLFYLAFADSSSITDYSSAKILAKKIAEALLQTFTYSALQTNAQNIIGAINEVSTASGGASDLDDLSDVDISSASNGQVLKYNGTSGKWENAAESGGGASDLDDLSDVDISSASNGQVLKYNGTSGKWENAAESGGGAYTAGDNINISAQNVISARRQPQNMLFGGEYLKSGICNRALGLHLGTLWNSDLTDGTYGLTIIGTSEYEYDENLEYKGVSGVEFEQSSYNLYFKIYIDGSFYGVKLYIADPSLGLSNETFTLGGVDFSVEAVSGFTLNYMRIKNIMYDDSNGSHVCELVGLSLENAVYNDVPSNSKDATLMYYLRKKLDEFYTKTGTLTAGSTTITLTDSKLLTSSTFEIFTDTWGVNPTNVVVATGSITLTFEAQQNDVAVKVRWI